jgi:hypothetical protein
LTWVYLKRRSVGVYIGESDRDGLFVGDGVHELLYGVAHIREYEVREQRAKENDDGVAHHYFQRFFCFVHKLHIQELNRAVDDNRNNGDCEYNIHRMITVAKIKASKPARGGISEAANITKKLKRAAREAEPRASYPTRSGG